MGIDGIMKNGILKCLVQQFGKAGMSCSQIDNNTVGLRRIVIKVKMGNGLYPVNKLRKCKVVEVGVDGSRILSICDQRLADDTICKDQDKTHCQFLSLL